MLDFINTATSIVFACTFIGFIYGGKNEKHVL